MTTEKKHLPLTTQIACLARTPTGDGESAWRWDWEDIARACLMVARDAARMATMSEEDWTSMMEQIVALEADDIAVGGKRLPLHDDGRPITFADRGERGEWELCDEGEPQ